MKNEFKAGDLVFELSFMSGIKLTELTTYDNPTYSIKGSSGPYTANGLEFDGEKGVPTLLRATHEMRKKLVAIWGEDAVPELPLRGSELTRKLLEKQKYVLCLVSHTSDDKARSNNPPRVRTVAGVDRDLFESVTGLMNKYAVPIDNNGNEITEVE